jgi:hypothetical protein
MTDELPPELVAFASLLDSQPILVLARSRYRLPVSGNNSGHSKPGSVSGS